MLDRSERERVLSFLVSRRGRDQVRFATRRHLENALDFLSQEGLLRDDRWALVDVGWRGNTVEARNVGRDITQGLRNIVGGEMKAYSELLSKARDEAISRAEADAQEMGADALVNLRLETSTVTEGGAEVLAYGTAVRLR